MKCLVPIKRVLDYNERAKLDHLGQLDLSRSQFITNPTDAVALEEACRQKEKGAISEIIAISVGEHSDVLRRALAQGADRAILVSEVPQLIPINIAKVLKAIINKEGIELVIMGKQAIDDDANQCGQMLATMLAWPQITSCAALSLSAKSCIAEAETDSGIVKMHLALPAVVTTSLRLNQPRYVSMQDILRANTKPITYIKATDLDVKCRQHLEYSSLRYPKPRTPCKIINTTELANLLKEYL